MEQEIVYVALVKYNLFNKPLKDILVKLKQKTALSNEKLMQAITYLKNSKRIFVNSNTISNREKLFTSKIKTNLNGAYVYCLADGKKYPIENLNGAKDGDNVEVGFTYVGQTKHAFICKVITNSPNTIVGEVRLIKGEYRFIPDDNILNKDYVLDYNDFESLINKKIVATVSNENNYQVHLKLESILGNSGDPIVENIAIASSFGFNKYFNKEVEDEVKKFGDGLSKEEIAKRLDLTDKNFVTIDPATCKDMDDSVYVEKLDDGFLCYIAIADVSHYVKPYSALFFEAEKRGTSCYLGSDVYPMLPVRLSNDLCSLTENQVRPVLCAIVKIDNKGEILEYDFKKAIIKSRHKLSYEIAEDIHLSKNGCDEKYSDIKENIDTLYAASKKIGNLREARGKLDFNRPEPRFVFSADRKTVVDVVSEREDESHKVIENFMVLANEAAAMFCLNNRINSIYRVHESPREEVAKGLNTTLRYFNIPGVFPATAGGYQRMLKAIEKSKAKDLLAFQILRTLPKAKYSSENIGHFGLGLDYYLHFTSPIRRFPDLVVHQVISNYLSGQASLYTEEETNDMAYCSSVQERLANSAEQKSNSLLFAMWASEHIDETFKAKVYREAENGIIVKVKEHIEMFVPNNTLIEKGAPKKYKIGNDILVKITAIDKKSYKIFADETTLSNQIENEFDFTKNNEPQNER